MADGPVWFYLDSVGHEAPIPIEVGDLVRTRYQSDSLSEPFPVVDFIGNSVILLGHVGRTFQCDPDNAILVHKPTSNKYPFTVPKEKEE